MTTALPAPADDGAADHLPGRCLPAVELPASDGRLVRLDELPARSVVFVYPSMGGPGAEELLDQWTAIPGARGCTPEACSFRDELTGFLAAGFDVFGLSSQTSVSQREHVDRLALPYPLLSDETLALAHELGLPTFEFHGKRFLRRLTLVIVDAVIAAALYPVFPPDHAASHALAWISEHPDTS
jgi:peroxiredoxin